MKPRNLYLVLCVAGLVVPYAEFVPFVAQNGLNPRLLLQQAFASHSSAFFTLDVVMSAVALVAFMRVERFRQPVRAAWLPVVALLLVGVSLALPLFLYLREPRGVE